MRNKRYFHELPIHERVEALNSGKKIGWLVDTYNQPRWCGLPDALDQLGCWSLLNFTKQSPVVTKNSCGGCEFFLSNKRTVVK